MKTSSVTFYSTGYRETRTYLAAALFAAGNIVLPQLCHLVQLGGPTMLPIYFFTLVGAYKYGWRTGLSPCPFPAVTTWRPPSRTAVTVPMIPRVYPTP